MNIEDLFVTSNPNGSTVRITFGELRTDVIKNVFRVSDDGSYVTVQAKGRSPIKYKSGPPMSVQELTE
jgi:hypothetical protein